MKTIFWNIGDSSVKKLELISETIISETPDIFCIAEGSHSKGSCQNLIDEFTKHKYSCYYSPLFSDKVELKLDYGYNAFGLKIFVKDATIPEIPFEFAMQRHEGRIIVLKAFKDYKLTTFIFLHNKSQVGDPTYKPVPLILSIKEMIKYGKVTVDATSKEIMGDKERVIIIGDFNIEPWHQILNHKDYLSTAFFVNHNARNKRKNNSEKCYFNPIMELISKTNIENLGGTYYNDNNGWALFDFVLYDSNNGKVTYDILTKLNTGRILLDEDSSLNKAFLKDELDHLPIITKIED